MNRDYNRVIAIKEKSAGNDSVGDMWLETKSFTPNTPISEIIAWQGVRGGKLIITVDDTIVDGFPVEKSGLPF